MIDFPVSFFKRMLVLSIVFHFVVFLKLGEKKILLKKAVYGGFVAQKASAITLGIGIKG